MSKNEPTDIQQLTATVYNALKAMNDAIAAENWVNAIKLNHSATCDLAVIRSRIFAKFDEQGQKPQPE